MMTERTGIGFVGCGNVSNLYFNVARTFENLDVIACADVDLKRARAQADKYHLRRACTVEDLLADAGIEIVVNLTPPGAHAQVALAALEAGKSVYNEKHWRSSDSTLNKSWNWLSASPCSWAARRTPSWVPGCRLAEN
jgi:hypothetical protein